MTPAPAPKRSAERPAVWTYTTGSGPYRVVAEELATRGYVVYLRWRARNARTGKPNWKWESTGLSVRSDAKGQPLTARARREAERRAQDVADAKFAALKTGAGEPVPAASTRPLTLADTWAELTDEGYGRYPKNTPHRREVKRELEHAVRLLGGETPWNALTMDHLTTLWRRRIAEIRAKGGAGYRGAEITIDRLLAIATWLRGRGKIALTACQPSPTWTEALARDWQLLAEEDRAYEPTRPRHTNAETRRLLAVAPQVDPRFDLLVGLGMELRLAQVRRARRTDLDLAQRTVQIHGTGRKKRGTIVECTDGQWAAVERALTGYLAPLEAAFLAGEIPDYRLFPGGQLPGGRTAKGGRRPAKGRAATTATPGTRETPGPVAPVTVVARHAMAAPIGMTAVRTWWREAERLAQVPQLKGRVTYGGRRSAVDMTKTLEGAGDPSANDEALQNLGGWADSQVPDTIYADQARVHQRRAGRELRAKIRGEIPASTTASTPPSTTDSSSVSPRTQGEDDGDRVGKTYTTTEPAPRLSTPVHGGSDD